MIYVKAGTYVEDVRIKKSGEENKPIILSCAPGDLGKVKVTPSKEYVEKNPQRSGHHAARRSVMSGSTASSSRGRWAGRRRRRRKPTGPTASPGPDKAGKGCRATNNVVYGNVHCGMKEMGHGGTKILMEGNVIFDNGTESPDHGIYCPSDDLTLNGNVIFNNAGFGIHSYSHAETSGYHPQRLLRQQGRRASSWPAASARSSTTSAPTTASGSSTSAAAAPSNVVKNNIFAFNKTDCGYDNGGGKYGDPADNTDDFNCYFPGKPHPAIKPGRTS